MRLFKYLLFLLVALTSLSNIAMAAEKDEKTSDKKEKNKISFKPKATIWTGFSSGDLNKATEKKTDQPDFVISRLHLGVGAKIGKRFKFSAKGEFDLGDTTAFSVKDAYGTWNAFGRYFGFTIGKQPSQLFTLTEAFWGYSWAAHSFSGGELITENSKAGKTATDYKSWAKNSAIGLVLHSDPLDFLQINAFFMEATKNLQVQSKKKSWWTGVNFKFQIDPLLLYLAYANQGKANIIDFLFGVEFDHIRTGFEYGVLFGKNEDNLYTADGATYGSTGEIFVSDHNFTIFFVSGLPSIDWLEFVFRYIAFLSNEEETVSGTTTNTTKIGHLAQLGIQFKPIKYYQLGIFYSYAGEGKEVETGSTTSESWVGTDHAITVDWQFNF